MAHAVGAVGAIGSGAGPSISKTQKKITKASAAMLSSLLELFVFGLVTAINMPSIADAIVRGINPFYELLLSIGL